MDAGIDHVRNFIQQTHYIFRLRTTLRSISFTCFKCRHFRGQEIQPRVIQGLFSVPLNFLIWLD